MPILFYFLYVGVRQLQDPIGCASLFYPINLCIHEGGHLLFRPFGEFIHVAGGTLSQLSAPLISIYILLRQRDYFGVIFCLGWLSTNLKEVGVYMSDAQDMVLPLISVEGTGAEDQVITHDWNYLFDRLGLLRSCNVIGNATCGLAVMVMFAAILMGSLILWEMFNVNHSHK